MGSDGDRGVKSGESTERPRSWRPRPGRPRSGSRAGWLLLGAVLLGAALLAAVSGCGTRYVRESFLDKPDLRINLRSQKAGGEIVDRGFDQPATVSTARLANILSRIDVRDDAKDGVRKAAIPSETLFAIAGGVSEALAAADSSQEIVVQSVRRSRRLGIFTQKNVTGLVLWVQGDDLVVNLTQLDEPVEKAREEKLPEPWTDRPSGKFRVIAGPSMTPVATNALLISWKDPIFRKSTNIRIGAGGRVIRREILLEEAPEEAPATATPLPEGLTPEILRALADLEEERRDGSISEGEYQRRRRALLRGEASP